MTKRALYFGCRSPDLLGHYLQEGFRTIHSPPPECPWTVDLMDGGLLRNGRRLDVEDGRVWWTCGGKTQDSLWYAFYWWDNSADKRAASNSGFYVGGFAPEILTPKTARENSSLAFEYACASYPWVIARQRHPLRLQEIAL